MFITLSASDPHSTVIRLLLFCPLHISLEIVLELFPFEYNRVNEHAIPIDYSPFLLLQFLVTACTSQLIAYSITDSNILFIEFQKDE